MHWHCGGADDVLITRTRRIRGWADGDRHVTFRNATSLRPRHPNITTLPFTHYELYTRLLIVVAIYHTLSIFEHYDYMHFI